MAQRKVNCEVYTDRGIVGKDGKSAYQQAVEGGYQGTEEEFHVCMVHGLGIAHTAERQYTAQHNYGDMFLAFLVCDI